MWIYHRDNIEKRLFVNYYRIAWTMVKLERVWQYLPDDNLPSAVIFSKNYENVSFAA